MTICKLEGNMMTALANCLETSVSKTLAHTKLQQSGSIFWWGAWELYTRNEARAQQKREQLQAFVFRLEDIFKHHKNEWLTLAAQLEKLPEDGQVTERTKVNARISEFYALTVGLQEVRAQLEEQNKAWFGRLPGAKGDCLTAIQKCEDALQGAIMQFIADLQINNFHNKVLSLKIFHGSKLKSPGEQFDAGIRELIRTGGQLSTINTYNPHASVSALHTSQYNMASAPPPYEQSLTTNNSNTEERRESFNNNMFGNKTPWSTHG